MSDFIITESFGTAGEQAESRVVDAIREATRRRETVGFWRYPLRSSLNNLKEPDILLLDPEWGVVIVEVKNIPITQLEGVQGYSWRLREPYFGRMEINPFEQARAQASAIIERIRSHPRLASVPVRALVALPGITRDEWEQAGQAFLFSDTPLLHRDELTPAAVERKVSRASTIRRGEPLDDETFRTLLSAFGTGGSLPGVAAPSPVPIAAPVSVQSAPPQPALTSLRKIDLLARAAEQRREFDLQQEQVAKTIPPGAQRIRGIAGSGKTVLLAQKAANMHLRHPDWDIALVFFCRALYDQMQTQLNHWLQLASGGEVRYQDARHKIRVLHAWGSKDQPGFYRTLAEHCGVKALDVQGVTAANGGKFLSPSASVILGARELVRAADLGGHSLECFDAVLIDEGQDLVDDDVALKYGGRQAFYWLAYRSLRPVAGQETLLGEAQKTQARRLIWAYDEAQSLDSLVLPRARELFGEELGQMLTGGTQYRGGIKKNEVMRRCYRTPGPILVAAHALGMGLLREEGMVAGLTRKDGWEDIGYRVEGELRSGHTVVLTRPPENSPNVIGRLSSEPLLGFSDHAARPDELRGLAARVRHAVEVDGLSLDRQLVICLGRFPERAVEATYRALRAEGLDVYVAANLRGNTPPATDGRDQNRNGFRLPEHVTVTGVTRAKGNEADYVHIVGLDEVGCAEDSVTLRNQLFVALSRSRGWVHLSGTNIPRGFLSEVMAVLGSGERLTFTMRQPKRNLNDEQEQEGGTVAAD